MSQKPPNMLSPHLCRPGYPCNILQKAFQIIEDFGVIHIPNGPYSKCELEFSHSNFIPVGHFQYFYLNSSQPF